MNKRKLTKYLLFFLFGYILLALTWWAVLLIKLNDKVYDQEKKIIELELTDIDSQEIATLKEFVTKERQRQITMIVGEGIVFGISILAGLWFIFRSYLSELRIAEHQKSFLVSVTHELNTPLASIKLVIDTLKKRKLEIDKEQRLYTTADSEINRLSTLVNNLLLAAKVESNYQYNFESQDLIEMINGVIANYRQKFPAHQFVFVPDQQMIVVDADRETMISLLNNLIENAIKYGNDKVITGLKIKDSSVILSVSDNGKGLHKKEIDKIFDKFYRLEQNRKDSSKGTGLGLFIVKEIVDAYSGTINILSANNGGTRFEIEIPQSQKK